MGKMPPGLRRYWAKKRKASKGGKRMARRYFGRKRSGRSKRSVPLLAAIGLITSGIKILCSNNGNMVGLGGDSPVYWMKQGNWGNVLVATGRELVVPKNWVPAAVGIGGDLVVRKVIGRIPITKGVSVA